MIPFASLLRMTSWTDSLLNCKEYENLDPKHKSGDKLNGSFRFTTYYNDPKSWFSCAKNIELPELISHYLHLNLTFVKPNDFDKKLGWYNETHSTGSLRMLVNNQVDYIIDDIYMNKTLWHPNGLIAMTTSLDDNYKINFLTKKYKIVKRFGNYNFIFEPSIWMLIISLIIIISGILCLNKMNQFRNSNFRKWDFKQSKFSKFKSEITKFPWKLFLCLLIDHYCLILAKYPSVILSKLIPRQLIMAAIPLLSILTTNLVSSSYSSHAIQPVREWCDSLDCFINHKSQVNDRHFQFYQYEDAFVSDLMKSKEFQSILERTEVHKARGKLKINRVV